MSPRTRGCLAGALLILAGCGTVVVEETALPDPMAETALRLAVADSLMLRGAFEACRDSLLRMLSDGLPREEILLRLTGLHAGRAMEGPLLLLLDSLEASGLAGLDGWRISILTLEGDRGAASVLAGPGRPLLAGRLGASQGVPLPADDVPCPATAGEVHAWASVMPPERMDRDDLAALVPFAGELPTVSAALLAGMAALSDTAGAWWWELADTLASSGLPGLATAAVCGRLAREDGGEPAWWLGILAGGGAQAPVAAAEIAARFPEALGPDWEVEDLLAASGSPGLARRLAATGDPGHRQGAEMSALLHEERLSELLSLCGDVDVGAPDTLRARAALFTLLARRALDVPPAELAPRWVAFAREYPWHPEARRLAYDAGKYYDCEQMWAQAAEAYGVSLRTAGSYEGDEQGTWRCGFALLLSGDPARADSVLASGAGRWPFGYWRDESLHWRAAAARSRGLGTLADSLTALVAAEHPWEYYGMLASRETGVVTLPPLVVPRILPSTDPACSTAVALLADGYADAALELLRSGPAPSAPERAATLSLLGMHGMALTMLRQMDQSLRDSSAGKLPDSLLSLYFPAPYLDLAESATAGLGLQAPVLLAIMREESYFDRRAVSSAGAMGVVQLMPGTAADVARWYGLPSLSGADFFDPAVSVPYGALYIDRQRSAYDGAEALFLAAYNAGPGNADRWVGMHGWNPADPSLYIEQITFRETRSYVKKVLLSSWIYEGYMR